MAILATTSPEIKRKSPLIKSRLSRSRKASPAEVASDRKRTRLLKGEVGSFHFEALKEGQI